MKRAVIAIYVILATFLGLYSTTIHYKADFSTDNYDEIGAHSTPCKTGDKSEVSYTPMLELGKEWRYNLYHFNVYRPKEEDRECVLRIEDVVEWDGKQFYSLEQYVDGNKVDRDEWGGGYLWEDYENRKIYFGARDYDGSMLTELLYDFDDPLNTPSVKGMLWGKNNAAVWEGYSGLDRELRNSYLFKDEKHSKFENFQLVEGLGFITSSDYEKYPDAHCVGTILSGVIGLAAGDCVLPKLYEVVNGKGEVIYSLETARPGYSSLNSVGRDEGGIVIGETAIEVMSDEPIGKVSVFNSVGMVVREVDIAGTQGRIFVSDLASGVYIVRTKRMNKKFTVK